MCDVVRQFHKEKVDMKWVIDITRINHSLSSSNYDSTDWFNHHDTIHFQQTVIAVSIDFLNIPSLTTSSNTKSQLNEVGEN